MLPFHGFIFAGMAAKITAAASVPVETVAPGVGEAGASEAGAAGAGEAGAGEAGAGEAGAGEAAPVA